MKNLFGKLFFKVLLFLTRLGLKLVDQPVSKQIAPENVKEENWKSRVIRELVSQEELELYARSKFTKPSEANARPIESDFYKPQFESVLMLLEAGATYNDLPQDMIAKWPVGMLAALLLKEPGLRISRAWKDILKLANLTPESVERNASLPVYPDSEITSRYNRDICLITASIKGVLHRFYGGPTGDADQFVKKFVEECMEVDPESYPWVEKVEFINSAQISSANVENGVTSILVMDRIYYRVDAIRSVILKDIKETA